MLRPGWVLEAYLGWSVVVSQPGLKILHRRYGPLVKWLVFADGVSASELEDAGDHHGLGGWPSLIVLNDFRAVDGASRVFAGRRLEPVRTQRWCGVGTFIIDLSASSETLWQRLMHRNECRAMLRQGARVSIAGRDGPGVLDAFTRMYGALASERNLQPVSVSALARMLADGRLLVVECRDAEGHILAVNLIYLGEGDGFFLHGVRAHGAPGGAGRLAQWETILELKRRGYVRYDLGQVPSCASDDGIYRFKRSLGGTFVDHGCEYRWRSPAWRLAEVLYTGFRAVRARA